MHASLRDFLQRMPHLRLATTGDVPMDSAPVDLLITMGEAAHRRCESFGRQLVGRGGGWLALIDPGDEAIPDLFGIQLSPAGPCTELRVLFENPDHAAAVRLDEAVYLNETQRTLNPVDEDSQVILYADWHHGRSPVAVCRTHGRGCTVATSLLGFDQDPLPRLIYRLMLLAAGRLPSRREIGVGILGYPSSVGRLHGQGIRQTPGLSLRVVCDRDQRRIEQARVDFADLHVHPAADALARDPEVDLVIVATPPNTHAALCAQMLSAGKHVVCEKPLALTQQETRDLLVLSQNQERLLSCHQNRRWDPDFRAIERAVRAGRIGELFHLETFVGGHRHPCGFWHSHEAISGGTAYDWGAHYLDWIIRLMPGRIEWVTSSVHKRFWHDVTNADQQSIRLNFSDGRQAEFMHSDIAAIAKPKWYLLGTRGAIVGRWRRISTYEIDPLLYYRRHAIPETEMPPSLTLRRLQEGTLITERMALPLPTPFAFHRNLADHLITGEPLAAPLEDSARVVAILEAARRSARHNGQPEVLHE